jgi:hypothetical protein
MTHLVSVDSLAAHGHGRGTDDSGHGRLDGHSAAGSLESAKADLTRAPRLVRRAGRRPLREGNSPGGAILTCLPTSA